MKSYDFQIATAERIAHIFREATIAPDRTEISSGGQRRVLLADEVGLGKTHVASAVIDRVRQMRRELHDDMFRVVYVCSNMSIANQNIGKLGIREKADVGESRLSMQHLTIREREARIVANGSDSMGEIIIPLTPATSFSLRGNSTGNLYERALVAVILLKFSDFAPFASEISDFFRGNAGDSSWQNALKRYSARVTRLGSHYLEDVMRYLTQNTAFIEIKTSLTQLLAAGPADSQTRTPIINSLRKIFADLSLSMLEPDLIIMDEFQRFSSLLDTSDESEQSAIVKRFFGSTGARQPLILLMSATPYKPLSTLEEIAEYRTDEHYEDFNRLMDFLFGSGTEFREVWADYSNRLAHLRSEKFDVVLASKNRAESVMYRAMCRTERLNHGLVSADRAAQITISADDVTSYSEMQKIVTACRRIAEEHKDFKFPWSYMPMEYVKSSPYLLSFMDTYELKQKITYGYTHYASCLPKPDRSVLIRHDDVAQFRRIPLRNARLQYLRDIMLPKGMGAELLLWVPASMPYYVTSLANPFVKNRTFSKCLVFSAWEMVPRMVATMMTYEAEREVIFSRYKKAGYDKSTGRQRLKKAAQEILKFPSQYLASLYRPAGSRGMKLKDIKDAIRGEVTHRLADIPKSDRRNYSKVLEVIRWLDDPELPRPSEMPANTIDILTDMAVAGPGVCLFRILGNVSLSRELAAGFVTIFNRRIAGYIIDKIQNKFHEDEYYLEGVLDYCAMGSLQAVLDEYRHLCSSADEFIDRMKGSFISVAPLRVETDRSFSSSNMAKFPMRAYYAVPFAVTRNNSDEKVEARSMNIRTAFQSPFYPFVLASTSVGQEGLDFHWYCRKVLHWNLPSNPQDMEQREGRVNRYKCLALRRNLAMIFQGIYDWDELFETARQEVCARFGSKYSEMVPYWCLPPEWIDESEDEIEWIERIVPQYPLSADVGRYKRLVEVLSLYRLTMGQPRQEELLDMLSTCELSADDIRQLIINLSPWHKPDISSYPEDLRNL